MKLATLCYVRRNGRTLMIHRIKKENDMHQGKWNGLGGKLEPGETPEECARRDVKGLYAKAFAGEIENFTGVSDPYEEPESPEIVCHTVQETAEESAAGVIAYLEEHGYVSK